jgi:hypothetical protein
MILMVSVALGCALLGCGAVHFAAKIPTRKLSRAASGRPDEARTLRGSGAQGPMHPPSLKEKSVAACEIGGAPTPPPHCHGKAVGAPGDGGPPPSPTRSYHFFHRLRLQQPEQPPSARMIGFTSARCAAIWPLKPDGQLFVVADAATLVADARYKGLLCNVLGRSRFREAIVYCRHAFFRRALHRVVDSLSERVVLELQGAAIRANQFRINRRRDFAVGHVDAEYVKVAVVVQLVVLVVKFAQRCGLELGLECGLRK